MSTTRRLVALFSVVMMVLVAGAASGQAFPSKPVRIMVSEAGSFLDITARLLAQGIAGPLGQPVIVENRPSVATGEFLARANADGYTLALGGGTLWLTQLTQKTSYDALKDLAPVAMVVTYPYVLAMHPSVPAKSVRELIDFAKAKPGVLNAGASGDPGASSWLGVELFKALSGANIVRVAYKGSGPGVIALLSNEIQLFFLAPGTVAPHAKSGKLRALAVTSLEPTPVVPGVPTVAATLPGYELILLAGIMAPAGTPAANINMLNQEMVRVLQKPDIKEKLLNEGAETLGGSPAQFGAKIRSEISKWGKVLKDAGIKVNE